MLTAPEPFPTQDRGGIAPSINPSRLPQRHQRSRKRGARTPEGIVYVGRPTIFGNPFPFRRFGHAKCVRLYARWIDGTLGALSLERLNFCPNEIEALLRWRDRLFDRLPAIAGRDLQCWCPTTSPWCHADVLMDRANSLIPGVPY